MKFNYLLKSLFKLLGDHSLRLFFTFFVVYTIFFLPLNYILRNILQSTAYENMMNNIKNVDISMSYHEITEAYNGIMLANMDLILKVFILAFLCFIVQVVIKYVSYIYEYSILSGGFSKFIKLILNYRSIIAFSMLFLLRIFFVIFSSFILILSLSFPVLLIIIFLLLIFILQIFDYLKMVIYLALFRSSKRKKSFFQTLMSIFKQIKIVEYSTFFNKKVIIYLLFLFISSFFLLIPAVGLSVRLAFNTMVFITLDMVYLKTNELKIVMGEYNDMFGK